eukprot:Phypoly_transcript_07470.p1 GENE.Phypoly_transcript_07470~~Phypoly_transcript_07470.p1  ORF type:complete len:342 (-),score=53.11 Phypoly_transcript_07470:164-1189(-)
MQNDVLYKSHQATTPRKEACCGLVPVRRSILDATNDRVTSNQQQQLCTFCKLFLFLFFLHALYFLSQHLYPYTTMASPQKNNPPPTTTCDDGNSCVICFEHIDLESKAIIKNCTHIFCFTCIKSWMATTNTCPLCKQTIDVLQHSFTSDESFQEEKVEAPNLKHGDSSGGGQSNVEDQLQCLDHAFFIGEVQRLLNDAERRHRTLWQEAQSHRGLAMFEQQQLGTVESVVAELRNHKRKLQALLQFDPHATLQDLYRLQDLLQGSWGMPAVTHTRARSPVRYGADDADAAADLSDEDDFAEEMAYMSIKGGKGKTTQRQSKAKRAATSKSGNSRNRQGLAN